VRRFRMKKIIVIWSMFALLLSATYGFAQMGGGMMGDAERGDETTGHDG